MNRNAIGPAQGQMPRAGNKGPLRTSARPFLRLILTRLATTLHLPAAPASAASPAPQGRTDAAASLGCSGYLAPCTDVLISDFDPCGSCPALPPSTLRNVIKDHPSKRSRLSTAFPDYHKHSQNVLRFLRSQSLCWILDPQIPHSQVTCSPARPVGLEGATS